MKPAHQSDAHALIPLIESTQKRRMGPEEVVGDSLYGSDVNCEKAAALGVEVVSPVMGPPPEARLTLADFAMTDTGCVTACPEGHAPEKNRQKKNHHRVVFNSAVCQTCPRVNNCPVKPKEKGHTLRY